MTLLGQNTGNVLDMITAASDEEKTRNREEKTRNREVIKTFIRSLNFLVKHLPGEASITTYNNFQ